MLKKNQALLMATVLAAALASAESHGPDLAGMDRSILPGANFFDYANGTWIRTTTIPADRSSYGSGAILAELTAKQVSDLIAQIASQSSPAGSEAQKIGDYYSSFMDEAAIESKDLQPLKPALARIEAISNRSQLAQALGESLRADVDVLNATNLHTNNLFGLWVAQDLDDPTRYVPFLLQGGLGMPDRDYYLGTSKQMVAIRAKYQAHVAAVLKMIGVEDSVAKAAKVIELERRMALVHWTLARSEQVSQGNNHWIRAKFERAAPGLDWQKFFAAASLQNQQDFVVWQPSALIGLSKLTLSESLETWKDYLRFQAVDDVSGYLPKRFVDEQFAFYGTALSGTPQLRPRWKRAVSATNGALGEAVGKLYVQRYFSPQEKARAEAMVQNILAAFSVRIDRLDWMTPATKLKAKAKLAVLKVSVGYPDHWRSYSALQVIRGDALGNFERSQAFEYRRNLEKLGKPVDRAEWVMNPQTVNAVNLPAMNAINFPAAILQPPYFDPQQPAVMDYGAIGAVIGHEISHSFDDQGALFDADGRLKNWWKPEDFAHFRASGARLAAQYDAYKPFPDLKINGKQTLSENIADVAGLNAAYDAYRISIQNGPAPSAAGFNGDQLFFVSFAQSWRQKTREAELRNEIISDGHAPDQYRTYTVRNVDAWYAAFDVKPGQALYLSKADRVRVW
jgi:putative endopeptidase